MIMTNAELAILSLIVEIPRHGYEIEQVIEQRGMRQWTEIGFSSIYYVLKKLEQNGWVQSQVVFEEGPGPARKVYHLTEEGHVAWQDATLEALSHPAGRHMPLMLGLNNLPGVPLEQAVAALRQYSARLEERDDLIRARRQQQAPLPYFVDAMFDLSSTLVQAEAIWVRKFIAQMLEGTSGSERGAGDGPFHPIDHEEQEGQ
jgi:DNA-binding PadR family transcriptional regulator